MEVAELKKRYDVLAKKFKLPEFKKLDEDFEIWKIERENDMLLRTVRKQMMEKIVNSFGFVDMLLTGANAPQMYFTYMKSISSDDRQRLQRIYGIFSKLIVSSLELEIEYDEKAEAELIREISKSWDDVREDFKKVMKNIKNPSSENNNKREKSYFG